MNTVKHYTDLDSMLQTAIEEDKTDDFIRNLFNMAAMVMWYEMDPETKAYVDQCSREIWQHLYGKVDIYKKDSAAQT
jgi:hypothetical protein